MSRKLTKKYWLALALLVTLLFAYAHQRDLPGRRLEHQRSRQAVTELGRQLETLHEREGHLRQRVKRLDTDPVEMEAAIRRNKNLVRKGETVYRIELEPE